MKLKKTSPYLAMTLLVSAALLSGAALAAPQISQVTSATSSGDTQFVITGSGFTTGPTVALYDTFNQGTSGQVVSGNTATKGSWLRNTGPYYMSYLTDEIGFAANRMPRGASYEDRIGQMVARLGSRTSQLFVSYSVYLPPGASFSGTNSPQTWPSVASWKMAWAMDTENGFQGGGLANIILPNANGNGNFAIDGNSGDMLQSLPPSTYHNYLLSPSSVQNFRDYWDWTNPNSMAFYIKPTLDLLLLRSGEIYWRIANTRNKLVEQTVGNVVAALPSTSNMYDTINFPGWWGNGESGNFQAVYDNVYIAYGANIKARVELTDSATYSQSTKVYPVPYVEWSSGRIVLSANTINLRRTDNLFVHVTDNNGARVGAGVKLCNSCTGTTSTTPKEATQVNAR
jgi:hypothetical protein